MKKFLIVLGLIVLAAAGYIYKFQPRVWQAVLHESNSAINDTLNSSDLLPPPLRSALNGRSGQLTVAGTIEQTNQQRDDNGLVALHENAELDHDAQLKLQDMFNQQYFEHVSPQGRGPSDLANEVDYKYIMVGENLALGNFENDAALVQAWMNSPGHRANILNTRYQEIGVAVGKGMFEGRETWLAVQEFGTPLSACPQPDSNLKTQITANQSQINSLQADLAAKKADLQNNHYGRDEYNSKVEAYNSEVQQINSLISQTKALVNQYNTQINAFNACLQG